MSTVTEKLTVERFRELYSDRKPNFELLDGEPVQKALGTKRHSALQLVLAMILGELGFDPLPELTLAISPTWEPVPDVCGTTEDFDDPYPTRPIAVAIEILSPADPFTRVIRKCRKYAEWGVPDILVFDPVGHEAWYWDVTRGDLRRIEDRYSFRSRPVEIVVAEVFVRLNKKLQRRSDRP